MRSTLGGTGLIRLPANPMLRAFTLIELLIVVAIIAILAAIAVPNFLEAQTRSKISRALSDVRTLATVLELYRVDGNVYPPHAELLNTGVYQYPAVTGGLTTIDLLPLTPLTSPVAYLTSIPRDPFMSTKAGIAGLGYGYVNSRLIRDILIGRGLVDSANGVLPAYGEWRLYIAGPDADRGRDTKINVLYDVTNGTVSDGDIVRTQREAQLTLAEDE